LRRGRRGLRADIQALRGFAVLAVILFHAGLPLALWLLPGRWRTAGVAAGSLVSLALYLWPYPRSPGAAFYLLPARAWELGLGVLAAILAARPRSRGRTEAPWVALPLAAVMILPVVLPPSGVPLHWLALPVCLATAALLLAALPSPRALAPLERIGDASYSLYRDAHHLSGSGSALVGRRFRLGQAVRAAAAQRSR